MGTKLYKGAKRIHPHEALSRSAGFFHGLTDKPSGAAADATYGNDSAVSYEAAKLPWFALGPAGGAGAAFAESLDSTTFTANQFNDKISLTANDLSDGHYFVMSQFCWYNGSYANKSTFRLYNDTTSTSGQVLSTSSYNSDWVMTATLFDMFDMTGTNTVKLQVKSNGGSNLVVLRARLHMWRLV